MRFLKEADELRKIKGKAFFLQYFMILGLVGTALYTAPEVTLRNTTYNQKVDLYSLGVIFFEMCYPPLQTGMERIKVNIISLDF